jgi:hypothetical protein
VKNEAAWKTMTFDPAVTHSVIVECYIYRHNVEPSI